MRLCLSRLYDYFIRIILNQIYWDIRRSDKFITLFINNNVNNNKTNNNTLTSSRPLFISYNTSRRLNYKSNRLARSMPDCFTSCDCALGPRTTDDSVSWYMIFTDYYVYMLLRVHISKLVPNKGRDFHYRFELYYILY